MKNNDNYGNFYAVVLSQESNTSIIYIFWYTSTLQMCVPSTLQETVITITLTITYPVMTQITGVTVQAAKRIQVNI